MPYYPPSTGGGTGPVVVPTLQEVLESGSVVVDETGTVTQKFVIQLGSYEYVTELGALGAMSGVTDDLGVVRQVGMAPTGPGVVWREDDDTDKMAVLLRGTNTEFIQVLMPATSGTLALLSDIPTGGGDVPTLQEVLTKDGTARGSGISMTIESDIATTAVNGYGVTVMKDDGTGNPLTVTALDGESLLFQTPDGSLVTLTPSATGGEVKLPATSGTLALQSEVATVDALVENLETALAAQQITIGTLSSDVATLKSDYSALLLRVAALENPEA